MFNFVNIFVTNNLEQVGWQHQSNKYVLFTPNLLNDFTTLPEEKNYLNNYPVDTDVFKTPSGRSKKFMTSYEQTRRRHNLWQKT